MSVDFNEPRCGWPAEEAITELLSDAQWGTPLIILFLMTLVCPLMGLLASYNMSVPAFPLPSVFLFLPLPSDRASQHGPLFSPGFRVYPSWKFALGFFQDVKISCSRKSHWVNEFLLIQSYLPTPLLTYPPNVIPALLPWLPPLDAS